MDACIGFWGKRCGELGLWALPVDERERERERDRRGLEGLRRLSGYVSLSRASFGLRPWLAPVFRREEEDAAMLAKASGESKSAAAAAGSFAFILNGKATLGLAEPFDVDAAGGKELPVSFCRPLVGCSDVGGALSSSSPSSFSS